VKKKPAKRIDWNWEWGGAIEGLHLYKKPLGVLELLAAGAPVPDWVREQIALWLDGKRPPWPGPKDGPKGDDDRRLLAAMRDYHDKTSRPKGETQKVRIARIAAKHNVPKNWIEQWLRGEGSRWRRLVQDYRAWEQVYLND
jgi:hypothetical protein